MKSIYIRLAAVCLTMAMFSCESDDSKVEDSPGNESRPPLEGVFMTANPTQNVFAPTSPRYWINGEINSLEQPDPNNVATSIAVSNGDVYVGGYCEMSINNSNGYVAAYWKNGIRTTLEDQGHESWIYCTEADEDGNIYFGGRLGDYTAYWKNGETGVEWSTPGEVLDAAAFGNRVFFGGYREMNYVNVATLWEAGNGRAISLLSNPYGQQYGASVNAVGVDSQGIIYAGGYCYGDSPFYGKIAGYWKNGEWIELKKSGDNVYNMSAEVTDICISGSDIYMSGWWYNYNPESPVSEPGYWKNGEWNPLGTSIYPDDDLCAKKIAVKDGDVYVLGDAYVRKESYEAGQSPYSQSYCGYWLNGEWFDLDGWDKTVYPGSYAGGMCVK